MNEDLLHRASGELTVWQRTLVWNKSRESERAVGPQEELRGAVAAGKDELAAYLRHKMQLGDAKIDAPPFPRVALTHKEFENPPIALENDLAEAWMEHIRPIDAYQSAFWYLCHIGWLEDGRFGDAPQFAYGERGKHLDEQTRIFLRRMGGIYVRSTYTVLTDCPLAIAWWRCRIADSVAQTSPVLSRDVAHRALHSEKAVQGAWNEFMERSVSKLTVINQPRARAVIIEEISKHGKPMGAMVKRITNALARQGLSRSLEHTPWEELREIAARAAAEDA